MARFKKHVIVYDDTPQIIAEREMGDVSKWVDLVKANNLRYPYIVDTAEEKLKDINHLVTLGDEIIVPIEQTLADINADKLSKYDKTVLEEIVLGNDLKIDTYIDEANLHGAEDEILELDGEKGDVRLVKGFDTIKQMITLRLLTPKGALPLHPNYGSNMQEYLGQRNSLDLADKINIDIQSCLEADSRIRVAKLIQYNIIEEIYQAEWEVQLYSFDKYFSILIKRDNDNNFIIM